MLAWSTPVRPAGQVSAKSFLLEGVLPARSSAMRGGAMAEATQMRAKATQIFIIVMCLAGRRARAGVSMVRLERRQGKRRRHLG